MRNVLQWLVDRLGFWGSLGLVVGLGGVMAEVLLRAAECRRVRRGRACVIWYAWCAWSPRAHRLPILATTDDEAARTAKLFGWQVARVRVEVRP